MRGLPGLIIAAGLGIVGAICNWFYLSRQASQMEKVSFVAVESTAQLNLGDHFKESDLVQVDIPKDHLGNLNEVAIYWKDRRTVIGMPATKAYRGGELVLQSDLLTPSERDFSHLLAEDEVARWVPVDSRSFVPERISPGNLISFITSGTGEGRSPGNSAQPAISSTGTEIIGPFRILSLGARTGDRDVRLAHSRSSGQESLIGIRVKVIDGKLEPKADRLFQVLSMNNAPLQVMLHSHELEEKPLP
jgi:Flp pilus assembly protein CpaB